MNTNLLSLIIIVVSVLFWLYLILKITLFRYLKLKRSSNESEKGRPINGTIVSVDKTGRGKLQSIRMKVEFLNFSQTPVQEEFRFVDSRPDENRYEKGKRVTLLIEEDSKQAPVVKIAGGKTIIGKGFLLISAILLAGAFYGATFIYKLTLARIENDWSKTNLLFEGNEAMPSTGLIFLGVIIFQWILFRLLKKIGSSSKKINDRELKFYGEKAMASIHRYEDTGVTINDNPKVKFHYSFMDRNGREHQSEDAVVIGKLEIGLLPTMKEKEVFYMPQKPEHSKFTENLAPQSLAGCLNVVLIFEAAVFTGVLIGMYVANLI